MLDYLIQIALGRVDANANQVRAAIAALQITHGKPAAGGKKGERQAAADGAEQGKYAPSGAPKLVVNNG